MPHCSCPLIKQNLAAPDFGAETCGGTFPALCKIGKILGKIFLHFFKLPIEKSTKKW